MLTRIEALLFRVLVQRRLRLLLPLSQRICGCGLSIDPLGHHRAACSRTGALGRRGFALESALARVCREAGGRSATWTWASQALATTDGGRWSLAQHVRRETFGGGGGRPSSLRRGAVGCRHHDRDGVALAAARRVKERTYPELLDPGRRARLVVFALEVGGRGQDLHPSAGQGTCPIRTQVASKTSVAVEVVRNQFMCRGQILCCVSTGLAGSAESVFGQYFFGHPHLTNLGQSNLGQSIFGHRVLGPANLGQNQFWPTQFWATISVLVVSQSVRP